MKLTRKPRPDSVIGSRIKPELRDEIDTMLLSGGSYRDVQDKLESAGVKISIEAIRRYYHGQILPIRLARQNKTAEQINKLDNKGLDEAALRAVRSTVFDLASAPGSDPKTLKTLFDIVQGYTKTKLETARLQLDMDKWETMAAQALLDKALSAEVQAIVSGDIGEDGKVSALRSLLFGKRQAIDPQFIND